MKQRKLEIGIFFALLLAALLVWLELRPSTQSYQKPSDLSEFSKDQLPQEKFQGSSPQPHSPSQMPAVNEVSAQVQEKIQKLFTVLKRKNDNDPILDTEFRKMSAELKTALIQVYEKTPMELRNDRGTIVFLLARDVQVPEDLEFLKKVFAEQPCLSLKDCTSAVGEDSHHSSTNQMTMNYPQLAALYQLDKQFQERPDLLKDRNFLDQARDVIKQSEIFPVPVVQKKAAEIKSKYQF